MSGYRLQRYLTLAFGDDTGYGGLEVRCRRSVPMGVALDFQAALESNFDGDMRAAAVWFAEHVLVSWNVEDEDGNPVPVTADALLACDTEFVGAIFSAWQRQVAEVPGPLAVTSNGGDGLAVALTNGASP